MSKLQQAAETTLLPIWIPSLCLLLAGHHAFCQQVAKPHPATMSMKQAKQFALAAVPSRAKHLPGFQFDSPPHSDNGLIIFNAIWDGAKDGGSVEIGFYEVDPVTGAVWDGVMECQQIKTPELQKLQLQWRRQRGLSSAQIRKLGALGPQCSID